MKPGFSKNITCLVLALTMTFSLLPVTAVAQSPAPEDAETSALSGKTISILGDSISTFAGYIPTADGSNLEHLARYPQDNLLTDVNDTWWMQVIHALDAKLGINDSWRGSTVSGAASVTSGVSGEKSSMSNLQCIQNLGSNGTPDVILFYGGTNDLARVSKLGAFDPKTAPDAVDLTTAKWDNLADAYVQTLLRLRHTYPNAVIVAMLPTYTASYYSNEKLAKANEMLSAVCEHYGVPYVDLRYCGITTDDLPDGIHPNATGMDFISHGVLDVLCKENTIRPGENVVYAVSHDLSNAKASLAFYKGISAGAAFVESLTGDDLEVTVTMDGMDMTAESYKDGVISIASVTGDLVITAKGAFDANGHLQQLPDQLCADINLWTALEHDEAYYTATGWGVHSSGKVFSVTFPIADGDKLYATSFGKAGENGSSTNGIRVTYFFENGGVQSLSAAETYREFVTNGFLTAPEGTVAVNIPMWTNSDQWEIYILNLPHAYESTVTTPTCTEQGFTTHTCTICGNSYADSYVDAPGHDYSAGLCSVCGEDTVTASLEGNVLTLTGTIAEGTRILVACYDGDERLEGSKFLFWQGNSITEKIPTGEIVKLFFMAENWAPLRQFIPLSR